jgi:hypothetical protein
VHNLKKMRSSVHILWISYKVQEGRGFQEENVPRGTLLWNGNQQHLVYVENYFWGKRGGLCPKGLSARRLDW